MRILPEAVFGSVETKRIGAAPRAFATNALGDRGRQAGGLVAADPSLAASHGHGVERSPGGAHTSPGDAYLVGSGRTISIGVARARRRHEGGAIQWSRRTTEEPGAVRLMELDVATGQGMVSTRIREAPAGDFDHERVVTLARFGVV